MRELVNWEDTEVQYPNRFSQNSIGGGLVELTPSPGVVRKEGTPQNARNFNTMDLAAFEALLIGNENTRLIRQIMLDYAALREMLDNYEELDTARYNALKEQLALEISQCLMISAENTRVLTQAMREIDGVKGLLVDVTLTNTQAYPFNNSVKTVQLPALRNTKDYFVIPEVVESAGGFVGDFSVTDKLLNGFKIAFNGSASTVNVRCHVVGGM